LLTGHAFDPDGFRQDRPEVLQVRFIHTGKNVAPVQTGSNGTKSFFRESAFGRGGITPFSSLF
jgi:hypothetical protein